MSTAESQRDEVHAAKVPKKEKYIFISAFKNDVSSILGGFSEGKESTMPITAIKMP